METQEFVCQGMEGFTFQYPVIEKDLNWKWESSMDNTTICTSDTGIKVEKDLSPGIESGAVIAGMPDDLLQNPNGVYYKDVKYTDKEYSRILTFYYNQFDVSVVLPKVAFPNADIFLETIIKSFKLK